MRVSDDRYNRDRQRFDLALRMVRHGARAKTICAWTGLTEDRLRQLWRAYRPERASRRFHRLRAKVPHHAGSFLRSASLGFEASSLACLFYLLGLIPPDGRPDRALADSFSLKRVVTFCEAYETYLKLYPPARLSFEHAWFLLTALAAHDGIKLNVCGHCGRLYLAEPVRLPLTNCGCGSRRLGLPRRRTSSRKGVDRAAGRDVIHEAPSQEARINERSASPVPHDHMIDDAHADERQ
jgi:hypothetical protein